MDMLIWSADLGYSSAGALPFSAKVLDLVPKSVPLVVLDAGRFRILQRLHIEATAQRQCVTAPRWNVSPRPCGSTRAQGRASSPWAVARFKNRGAR